MISLIPLSSIPSEYAIALKCMTSSNCFFTISEIESRSANPHSISAVQPIIPISVMIILFLYLNAFLTVTLLKNESLLQMKRMRSISTRFPDAGAAGRISWAGTGVTAFKQLKSTVSAATARLTAVIMIASDHRNGISLT